ncbi:MAG TPA: hypothetical protein VGQ20_07215 [Acidimicrobiales bacterium]|jgi:hypothetical protein|nr:hypothetical protein [Acidimicrobiales bacterium]
MDPFRWFGWAGREPAEGEPAPRRRLRFPMLPATMRATAILWIVALVVLALLLLVSLL